MADRLSRIIGTEDDKVNCPFYFKIGACRYGDMCSRTHLRPTFSQTVMIPHLYMPPAPNPDGTIVDDKEAFEDFFEEIIEEFAKFGALEGLHVVENLGDHMFGNVYVQYHYEEGAEKCLNAMNGRYYAGRLVKPEFSPVTDFREARCRQHDEDTCNRGGYCNFMHMKHLSRHMRRLLRDARKGPKKKKRRSRSRSRGRHAKRERSAKRERRGRRRSYSRSRSRSKSPVSFARSGSAERRAKIAEWNKKRDAGSVKKEPKKDNYDRRVKQEHAG